MTSDVAPTTETQAMSIPNRLPFGKRLLPSLVDEYSHLSPSKILYSIPISSSMREWHHVTYSELSKAVDSLSFYIASKLGVTSSFETLSYMGANDIRYTLMFLAGMKCGYAVLPPSPRNSVEGQLHLLKETKCNKFVYSSEMGWKIAEIKSAVSDPSTLQTVQIPSYEDILGAYTKPYPFTKTWDELADKPAMIFHTSGTTGLPLPLRLPHSYVGVPDNLRYLKAPEGRKKRDWTVLAADDAYLNAFPLFHNAGTAMAFYIPVYEGTRVVMLPADIPLNQDTFLKICEHIEIRGAFLPPSFIEELSSSEVAFEKLSKIKYIFFGGGPLNFGAGDRLAKVTTIMPMLGSTEAGMVSSLICSDWKSWEWNPYYGVELEQIGESEFYEMVIRKQKETAAFQAVFKLFPEISEWRTRDLFTLVKEQPNCWSFAGRTDDVIVLGNGEKFNPVSIEDHIVSHPLLTSALVCGQGKFQVCLIVEPDWGKWGGEKDNQELIEEIWPRIKQANDFSARQGRVFRSMVMVVRKDKPFRRAGKGTLMRQATIIEYKDEIEALYAAAEEKSAILLPDEKSLESMKGFVRTCLENYLTGISVEDETDLFAMGLDSLQTLGFVKSIRAAVEPSLKSVGGSAVSPITQRTIYQNPSIGKMAEYLNNLFNPSNGTNVPREERIEAMIEKYTADLPAITEKPELGIMEENLNIILTGTTGYLGSYLLHSLLSNPSVSKIYCFNRSPDAKDRTTQSFASKGLTDSLSFPSSSRVEFWHTNLGSSHFGLDDEKYAVLVAKTDAIIHNAWTVDFNRGLESFEDPHVKSVRSFIDLSIKTGGRARLFFISSIGAVANYKSTLPSSQLSDSSAVVPECPLIDLRTPLTQGYSESKFVAERILALAAGKCGVKASIARVGQIAGPTTKAGRWNDVEWVPSLIRTSIALGKIPATLGTEGESVVDWIPADLMAASIVDLLLNNRRASSEEENEKCDVFHLVNWRTSTWSELVPALQEYVQNKGGKEATIVPYNDWVKELERVAQMGGAGKEDMQDIPVLKFLEFFQELKATTGLMMRLETGKTKEASAIVKGLEPVGREMMRNWLRQWGY